MVYMAGHIFQLGVHAAGFHFAIPPEGYDSIPSPTLPRRPLSRPLPVHTIPRHLLFPCAKACLAVEAAAVTISAVASKDGFEHFRPPVAAKWTKHIGSSFLWTVSLVLDGKKEDPIC